MEKREIVKTLVSQKLEDKDREELIEMVINNPISVDIDKQQEENTTFGERMADKISAIAGSWLFILLFLIFLITWIVLNVYILKDKIDPYPFILLNLVLSCVTAVQAPIIMMSQNREAKKDSMRNQNDYIVDLKSELILEDLHRKLELILEHQDKLLDIYKKQLEKEE